MALGLQAATETQKQSRGIEMEKVTAVIVAGGKGTRIASIAEGRPKSLMPIGGRSVLSRHLDLIRKSEIASHVYVVTSGRSEAIEEALSAEFAETDNVCIITEPNPLGSAGYLGEILGTAEGPVLILFGDVLSNLSFNEVLKFHRDRSADATVVVRTTDHPEDSDLVEVNLQNCVERILLKPHTQMPQKDALGITGVFMLSDSIYREIHGGFKDLVRDVIAPGVNSGRRVFALRSCCYFKDIGTPERYAQANLDWRSGKIDQSVPIARRRAAFIDRDGTIIEFKRRIGGIEDVELRPGVARAIRKVNESGALAIVVTNQPAIAHGTCSLEEVERINEYIESRLRTHGASLDGWYVCPHHPTSQSISRRLDYCVECSCRKPKPGLVERAMEGFEIDIARSAVFGDSWRDQQLAKHVGAGVYIVNSSETVSVEKAVVYDSLAEAVDLWLTSPSLGQRASL
jgi:mannose-1-phosphate guanylyltransferase / phosphomannomutase